LNRRQARSRWQWTGILQPIPTSAPEATHLLEKALFGDEFAFALSVLAEVLAKQWIGSTNDDKRMTESARHLLPEVQL
jgi:hypothetical protein